jgi:hypothetical protein
MPTVKHARAITAGVALMIAGLVAGLSTHAIVIDHYAGTYGASIGSNTSYASFELNHGIPAISWQSGN